MFHHYFYYHRKQRMVPVSSGYRLTDNSQRKERGRYKSRAVLFDVEYKFTVTTLILLLFLTVNNCPNDSYGLKLFVKRNPTITPVLINPVPPIHHASPIYCCQQEENNNNDVKEPDRYERKEKIMEGLIPTRSWEGIKSSPPMMNPTPTRSSSLREVAISKEEVHNQGESIIMPAAGHIAAPATSAPTNDAIESADNASPSSVIAANAPKHLPQVIQPRPPSPIETQKGSPAPKDSPTSCLALLVSPAAEKKPEEDEAVDPQPDFNPSVSEGFTLDKPIDPTLTDTPDHVKRETTDLANSAAETKVENSEMLPKDGSPEEVKEGEMEACSSAGGESLAAVVAKPNEGAGRMWSSDRTLPVDIPHDTIKALIYGLFNTAERQAIKENWSNSANRTQIISNIRKICCDFPAAYREAENKLSHLATIVNCLQSKINDAQNEMSNATEVFRSDPLRRLPYEEALHQMNAIEVWCTKAKQTLSGHETEAGAERARIVRNVLENVFVAADEMLKEGESVERAAREAKSEEVKGKGAKGGRGRGKGMKKE